MRAVCLQHVHFEGPGVLARSLEKRGVSLEPHLVPEHGLPQDPGDYLIVMGGPMSVNVRTPGSGIDALCRECPEDVTRANQTPASLMA